MLGEASFQSSSHFTSIVKGCHASTFANQNADQTNEDDKIQVVSSGGDDEVDWMDWEEIPAENDKDFELDFRFVISEREVDRTEGLILDEPENSDKSAPTVTLHEQLRVQLLTRRFENLVITQDARNNAISSLKAKIRHLGEFRCTHCTLSTCNHRTFSPSLTKGGYFLCRFNT